MTSVRFRLLILALTPLVVLMPLLLLLGMSRWSGEYDEVLIANVESDLKIASQYLARLLAQTGDELDSVARSVAFSRWFDQPEAIQVQMLERIRRELGLDFLRYLPFDDAVVSARDWPVIESAVGGDARAEIDIFSNERLTTISSELAAQARVRLVETPAAVPTERKIEDRGMVVHAASPVRLNGEQGVLVGGMLLNRNLAFIDRMNDLVYSDAVTGGDRQGTATLFLDDLRISTNVRLFEGVRALGTRVSAEVREAVLLEGRTWLDSAFVVNDWYISGYEPITDSFGKHVGMLYVGFLEAPFAQKKREAFWWLIGAFIVVLAISGPVFLWMARGIFSPLEQMTQVMRRVGRGELAARIGPVSAKGEIAAVAHHLDWLLEQVQERDRALRHWNDELNERVEQRTAELREANEKLEQTFRQLVMSEKLASIGEITAGVAHEINNPVAVIQGNVDVIRQTLGPQADPVTTELGLIDRQVSRIQVIVGKLLQFASPSEFSDCEHNTLLRPLIQDCLVLVDHLLSRGQINLICDLDDVPPVRADSGEIQQVVVNLIVNATQAMAGAGRLYISLNEADRDGRPGVALVVQDSGPGVPEALLASVFDPFFTTKPGEGTGLGLSISQTLIQRAGGIISVRNVAEGGAAFTVWLPQAEGAEEGGSR